MIVLAVAGSVRTIILHIALRLVRVPVFVRMVAVAVMMMYVVRSVCVVRFVIAL